MTGSRRDAVGRKAVGLAAVAALLVGVPACGGAGDTNRTDRWVTSQNTTVDIDWDAVGKAYREAEGPEDFERRVNEIYTGDEVISVAVRDLDEKTQEVTGFFDRDVNGKVEEEEKVFTLRRDVTGSEAAQYQIAGHGPYASYRSPMWDIASGMAMGYMISRAFSPGYAPAYRQGYVTSAQRRGALTSHRDSYRQNNPDKFRKSSPSKSGRSYGRKGSNFGGGKPSPSRPASSRTRSFGGGRFGRRGGPTGRVVRLTA